MHRSYFDGILYQIDFSHEQRSPARNVQEYMEIRRKTSAVYPAIPLMEYALGTRLPQHVVEHPSIQECMDIACELVVLYVLSLDIARKRQY